MSGVLEGQASTIQLQKQFLFVMCENIHDQLCRNSAEYAA